MRYLLPNRIIRGVGVGATTAGNAQMRVPPDGIGIWFVSAFIGNDQSGDGSLGKPFATITKAQTVAIAGQLIHVLPGIYNEWLLGKDGLYYYFELGAKVISSANGDNHLWYLPQQMSVWVGGYGEFIGNGTIRLQNDNSKFFMECLRLERPVTADFPCVSVVGGKLHLLVKDEIYCTNHYAVNIRNNSTAYIEVKKDITTVSPAGLGFNNCLNFTTVSNSEKSIIKARNIQILADDSLPASNRNTGLFISSSPNASLQINAHMLYNSHIAVEEFNYNAAINVDAGIKSLEVNAKVKSVGRFGIIATRGVAGSEIIINGDVESQLNKAVVHSAANTRLVLHGKTTSYGRQTIALGKSNYFAYQAGGTLEVNAPIYNRWNDIGGHGIVNYDGNLILNPSAAKIIVICPDAKSIYSPLMEKIIKVQGRIFASKDVGFLSKQEDQVLINQVQNDTDYVVTINSISVIYHSPMNGTTLMLIAAGVVAALNANSFPVTATDNLNGTYKIVGSTYGVSFTHIVSPNLTIIQKVLAGFNLINEITGGDIIYDENIG